MPWAEVSVVDRRYQVIQGLHAGVWSVSEAARQAGVSRKTLYKWLARFEEEGVAGLADRSRAPHRHPREVAAERLEAVLALRRAHPRWGVQKLRALLLERQPDEHWPSPSTLHRALVRAGLVPAERRRTRHHSAVPFSPLDTAALSEANAVWTLDFKGQFRLGNRRLCYPLTVQDYASRYLLACQGLAAPRETLTRTALEGVFRTYGLPQAILTDGGSPFAGTGVGRLSHLAVWWLKLDIRLYRTRPGCPQDNPRHERMHRELKAETARPPAASMSAQQRRFDRFSKEYNQLRPHQGLAQQPPARHYRASPRAFPARQRPWNYPGHFELRKVECTGRIWWQGESLHLNRALRGEYVGLEEIDEDLWQIYFRAHPLARFNSRERILYG